MLTVRVNFFYKCAYAHFLGKGVHGFHYIVIGGL